MHPWKSLFKVSVWVAFGTWSQSPVGLNSNGGEQKATKVLLSLCFSLGSSLGSPWPQSLITIYKNNILIIKAWCSKKLNLFHLQYKTSCCYGQSLLHHFSHIWSIACYKITEVSILILFRQQMWVQTLWHVCIRGVSLIYINIDSFLHPLSPFIYFCCLLLWPAL